MAIENPDRVVLKPQREGGGKEDQVFSTKIEGGNASCILRFFMLESFTD